MALNERRASFQIGESNKSFANQVLSHYGNFFEKNENAIEHLEASNPNKKTKKDIKTAQSKLEYLKNTIVGIENTKGFKNLTDESKDVFRKNTIDFLSSIQKADESRKDVKFTDFLSNSFEMIKYATPTAAMGLATATGAFFASPIPIASAAIAGVGGFATKRVNDIFEDKIKHYFNEARSDVKALFDKEGYQDKNLLTSLAKFEEAKSVNVLDNLYYKLKNENAISDNLNYAVTQMQAETRKDGKKVDSVDLNIKLEFKKDTPAITSTAWRDTVSSAKEVIPSLTK